MGLKVRVIKIFGHKSPDTDSTGSPIIWAWYLTNICKTPAQAYLLGSPNNEACFVLDQWGFEKPEIIDDVSESDSVIIVDTNNPAELPDNIGNAQIVGIIDHHLLQGGLSTREPINVTIKPLACTATIMHDLMGDGVDSLPAAVKGLMLSCIISDTMEFRSPTTTDHDKKVALNLASDLGIDIHNYAKEMFAAKSDVSMYTDSELLLIDSKLYELSGKKLRISVLETTNPKKIIERKLSIIEAIENVTANSDIDQILIFIVDILNENAVLLLPNDTVKTIAFNSFQAQSDTDQVLLPGIVSRKKQIIPQLVV